MSQFLEFEQPIAELQAKIEALKVVGEDAEVNISKEIARLEEKCQELTQAIFSRLSAWQVTQLARHPLRPHTLDYIEHIFTDFDELHGDRHYSSAPEIIGGIARLAGQPVMILGHQKGRNTKEKLKRNFGMARPESFRKALRLMKLAEKFHLPVLTFIDTPGAYPGIGAEKRNQSEAIAHNLSEMITLRTPIICLVTGEGSSGGALAIGVGDVLLMLQYSIYSVISPEGCASILWKDAGKAAAAADILGLTADRLKKFKLIDQVIEEPAGGAHRNVPKLMVDVKTYLAATLEQLSQKPMEDLLAARVEKWMKVGRT